jgi:hypothetical protein
MNRSGARSFKTTLAISAATKRLDRAVQAMTVLAATETSMLKASGFEPTSVGGIDQSVRIEPFGNLHQFGKLGKLVTAKETVAAL